MISTVSGIIVIAWPIKRLMGSVASRRTGSLKMPPRISWASRFGIDPHSMARTIFEGFENVPRIVCIGTLSGRVSVPATPHSPVSLEHEKQGRKGPDESVPDGPLVKPSRGGHDLKLPDEGHAQATPSGQPLQSPVEIDIFAHVPRLIIAAELFEYALPAELTGALRHAANKPKNPPKCQVGPQYEADRSM